MKSYSNEHCQINLIHGDCLEGMKFMEENEFDLAIVDPPYGIGTAALKNNHTRSKLAKSVKYKNYDNEIKDRPEQSYFDFLSLISSNQIIWGANHFGNMPSSSSWIVWYKQTGDNDFADAELAYTSFKNACRVFDFKWQGMLQGNMKNREKRIHPTQKPVALYKWLLKNYGGHTQDKVDFPNKILDTHGGSMSIAIACWDMGFDLTLYEIDEDYYKAGVKRFEEHIKKPQLFEPKEMYGKQIDAF